MEYGMSTRNAVDMAHEQSALLPVTGTQGFGNELARLMADRAAAAGTAFFASQAKSRPHVRCANVGRPDVYAEHDAEKAMEIAGKTG